MSETTLIALKKSITKWERNVAATMVYKIDTSIGGCPLCVLFFSPRDDEGRQCYGCPVSKKTGNTNCRGTPYYEVRNWMHDVEDSNGPLTEELAKACQAEVDFLKSLLPAEEQNNADGA